MSLFHVFLGAFYSSFGMNVSSLPHSWIIFRASSLPHPRRYLFLFIFSPATCLVCWLVYIALFVFSTCGIALPDLRVVVDALSRFLVFVWRLLIGSLCYRIKSQQGLEDIYVLLL